MQQNIEPSAIFFQTFNSVICSFTRSSSQCFEAPTASKFVADAQFLPNKRGTYRSGQKQRELDLS